MTARILVVDGQATNRITMKVRLGAACYHVTTAATAAQLQSELQGAHPQLILLGDGLSDGDPLQLCADLVREVPDIPVVMLADHSRRLDGLRAGAAAVLDPALGEQMLLARLRGLLRDHEGAFVQGMTEASTGFDHGQLQIALIADNPGRALCWKHLLGQRLPGQFLIRHPEEALTHAGRGRGADLYVIAADIEGSGDGLRLLSELRTRTGSRDAAFVIAVDRGHDEAAAMALDLGAGDVIGLNWGSDGAEVVALALQAQMQRKIRRDQRRQDEQRTMLWAMTDPLTGLFNRRYAMPRLAEFARQAGDRFAVLLMDLDHFKLVNDRYGHAAGDAVLCEVARRLQRMIGDSGLVARYGGEEFLAVLPATDESLACAMAERIRHMIEARPVLLPGLSGGGSVPISMSLGLALSAPADLQQGAEAACQLIMERADRALILAKNRGRNRVMLAPPADHPPSFAAQG